MASTFTPLSAIRALCQFCRELTGECLQSEEDGYTFRCKKCGYGWRLEVKLHFPQTFHPSAEN
jgi:uncharacterized Zn finger protein